MRRHLIENLRIDAEIIEKLRTETLLILAERYGSHKLRLLNVVNTAKTLTRSIPRIQVLKIKIEVDTDPPPGFDSVCFRLYSQPSRIKRSRIASDRDN